MIKKLRPTALGCLVLSLTLGTFLANAEDEVKITTTRVADGIYMLQGQGGNMGASVGEDGIVLIDDQYAPLTDKILTALGDISDRPLKFVINTHWHGDHTGGNENLGKKGVIIVAHDNVYERLNASQFQKVIGRKVAAAPKEALPVISFNDRATFHVNGLKLEARHFPYAHTDGDSILFFQHANVIHTGDIFFNGYYPYIDTNAGGSIHGLIKATETLLGMTDIHTKIIPGHGPLANRKNLEDYHLMLKRVVELVDPLVKQGLSLEEIQKRDPLKELNPDWGGGFMTPDRFLEAIYPTLAGTITG